MIYIDAKVSEENRDALGMGLKAAYDSLHNKSTTNRSNGVWAIHVVSGCLVFCGYDPNHWQADRDRLALRHIRPARRRPGPLTSISGRDRSISRAV